MLKLSNKIKNAITYAQSVTGLDRCEPGLPSRRPPLPWPSLPRADIAALVTAETAVLARTKGAVEARNAFKLGIVKSDLDNLQDVRAAGRLGCRQPEQRGGHRRERHVPTLRKVTLHDKPELGIKQGSVSGTNRSGGQGRGEAGRLRP